MGVSGMPINATQEVSREIKSLLFMDDGSLNGVMVKYEDGVQFGEESYRIEAADAAPILDSATVAGLTIRQQIVIAVYEYLITKGLVKGSIAA